LNENTRADFFWPNIQKIAAVCIMFFFGGAFALTGIKSCIGRGTDNNAPSVELERVSGRLDDIEKQFENAGDTASNLAEGLRSAAADVGEIQSDSRRLKQTIGSAGEQATAIGSRIEDLGVTDTAIWKTVGRIERFIEETNRANGLP
jgi:chromosome segregation ATPase